MGKNIGKNISKNLSSKYCQKVLDHAKKSATDALKTAFKRVSKTSPQNNLGSNKEEILRERFILPELTHKTNDNLRLKEENY